MTPNLVAQCGRALFGEDWTAPFRDRFGLGRRTLGRLMAGTITPSPAFLVEIAVAMRERNSEIYTALAAINFYVEKDQPCDFMSSQPHSSSSGL